ncbi:hypothetical protein [Streptomyces sp. NPDC002676]
MHMYLVIADLLVVTLMVGFGIAGITTGWVVPFGRHRVLRPKLWGYGQLTAAVGLSLWTFLGTIPGRADPLPVLGWVVFMGGMVVQLLAQAPGRTPKTGNAKTGATKSAS